MREYSVPVAAGASAIQGTAEYLSPEQKTTHALRLGTALRMTQPLAVN